VAGQSIGMPGWYVFADTGGFGGFFGIASGIDSFLTKARAPSPVRPARGRQLSREWRLLRRRAAPSGASAVLDASAQDDQEVSALDLLLGADG
jgi:hypothetical protein